ncbi:MAG: hypothetical protein M5U08_04740 [Burkholderiales bacterium]|nr:hypothetical protein [Burkholderiales bacterium]
MTPPAAPQGHAAVDLPVAARVPLLVLGFLSLAAGVAAGLVRLGWDVPRPAALDPAAHGPLMIVGFFGTVISLERAVALARRWAYLGPLAAGLAGVGAAFGAPGTAAASAATLAGAVLAAGSLVVLARQPALHMACLALGAGCWLVGNVLWLAGQPVALAVPWWTGFLVLTIAGERLELTRFLPPAPRARALFLAIVATVIGGAALALPAPEAGTLVLGTALLALAAWLLKQDIARRTVRQRGLTRFIAVCLLSGYFWLGLAGAIIVAAGGLVPGTASYDAALHAVMLGFVFSMVFGHAPVIFPAVLKVAVPYTPAFYGALAVLHASLVVRLAGDLAASYAWRAAGGMLNALALALFIAGTAIAVARGGRGRGAGTPSAPE